VPTYQYACTECGHHLEAVQSFSDEPLTECPNCGGKLRKQFSAVGIVFKGSGFYRTDSRTTSSASTSANGAGKDKGKDGASSSTDKAAPASSGDSTTKSKPSSDTGTSSNGSSSKKPVSTPS
jgi:putative FmdB family regulatory protein